MKYILKEKIPFAKYEVGHVFETDFQGDISYEAECDGTVSYDTIHPHEILLMVKAGILEEYDETFPKKGDVYWFIGSSSNIDWDNNEGLPKDTYRIKTNNCFRTQKEAEKKLKEIMGE